MASASRAVACSCSPVSPARSSSRPAHSSCSFLVLLLGLLRPGAGLLDRVGQPSGFLLGGGGLAARGSHLGAQPGQALGPDGLGAGAGRQPPFFLGQRGLRRGALRGGGGQLLTRGFQPLAEHHFLFAQRLRLEFELLRVAARAGRVRLGRQVSVPLLGQAGHAAEAFGERGQCEPGFLRGGEAGSVLLLVAVQLGLPLARLGQDALQLGAAGQRGRLVGLVTLAARRTRSRSRRRAAGAGSRAGRPG